MIFYGTDVSKKLEGVQCSSKLLKLWRGTITCSERNNSDIITKVSISLIDKIGYKWTWWIHMYVVIFETQTDLRLPMSPLEINWLCRGSQQKVPLYYLMEFDFYVLMSQKELFIGIESHFFIHMGGN